MTKVVINACFGGFSLSPEAERAYLARKGKQAFFYEHPRNADGRIDFDRFARLADPNNKAGLVTFTLTEDIGPEPTSEEINGSAGWFNDRDVPRDDPDLVAIVEEMGRAADGAHAKLQIVEIPDDVVWTVEEYDGSEHVAEQHRTWA